VEFTLDSSLSNYLNDFTKIKLQKVSFDRKWLKIVTLH